MSSLALSGAYAFTSVFGKDATAAMYEHLQNHSDCSLIAGAHVVGLHPSLTLTAGRQNFSAFQNGLRFPAQLPH